MKVRFILRLMAMVCLLAAFSSQADVVWRVSVKLLLDAAGNRPGIPVLDDLTIVEQIVFANTNAWFTSRGLRLELVELPVEIAGHAQWFNQDLTTNMPALEAAAKADSTYRWRSDAINIYINNGTAGGAGSLPNSGNDIVVLDANKIENKAWTVLHEIGHFMGLLHTHQGENCTATNCAGCPNPIGGNKDNMADTLSDHECFTDEDAIAQANYNKNYAALSPNQQLLVDYTRYNIMSYHDQRSILTPDQLDEEADTSNTSRNFVVEHRTVFVDATNLVPGWDGQSKPVSVAGLLFGGPFPLLKLGLDTAHDGDVVLIRPGTYVEDRLITTAVELRATRGTVIIRAQ
jgi:hypothetical protein